MNRGTIQMFLEAAAGTASKVFGEPTQRVAPGGGAARPEQWMHFRQGVGTGDQVGQRRARPRESSPVHHVRFLPAAVGGREHGGRRQSAGR